MATHIKNMTQGRPGKLILTFSLPLMAGNVFQQTYTVIETAAWAGADVILVISYLVTIKKLPASE